MTKAELINALRDVPDDAEVVAFNGDHGGNCPITGILYGPVSGNHRNHMPGCVPFGTHSHYVAGSDQRDEWQTVVELCTDDNS